jgi:hypothetical protein
MSMKWCMADFANLCSQRLKQVNDTRLLKQQVMVEL